MKVELVKRQDRWDLYGEDGSKIASSTPNPMGKLSIKNCEAIVNGYDLGELAMGYDLYENINFVGQTRAYKAGFQKALDLNNTKLYTLEDMMNCWNKALTFQNHKELFGYHIQALQQTEWDVEIEKENVMHDYNGNISLGAKFKLDVDGCLILKLKSE